MAPQAVMTWGDFFSFLGVMVAVGAIIIGILGKALWTIRHNDLHHIQTDVLRVLDAVRKLSKKVEDHLAKS